MAAAALVATLLAGVTVHLVTRSSPVFPTVAEAEPIPSAPLLAEAPSTTGTTETVPESTDAPPETEPEPEPEGEPEPTSTKSPARPVNARVGPPVWPSTGAQDMYNSPTVTVFDAPNGRARFTLSSPYGPLNSHPAFRVIGTAGSWLQVQLPTRPNGSTGWIRSSEVTQFSTNVSIDIDVNARWITVYDRDQIVMQGHVVVGTPATPSPLGNHYITDLVPKPGPGFGPYALGLSAHSNVLQEFAGGNGQVAIHGTNYPGLMGTAASHGCIRMQNSMIASLSKLTTIGVPVRIHAG